VLAGYVALPAHRVSRAVRILGSAAAAARTWTCREEVDGEGLVGLTWGFMYAGAKSVVASLWKVNDASTAELMRLFYDLWSTGA